MGMGGGTILIPLLTIFLNIVQKEAQAINLIVFLPMSIFALIIHSKKQNVMFKAGVPMIITGVIFSVFSSIFVGKTNSQILRIGFGVFLIVMGLFQIASIWFFKTKNIKKNSNDKIDRYHDCENCR
ncbi:MAG: sulfite exporter TauE/SafE family protein [Clostridia bacterium]|nr:sulfite exporter TauE/SafE family protein [Clostridia bacterium]